VHSALFLVGKLICCQTTFGSAVFPTFPANAGLIFLTDELTNDRYLVDNGATLSFVPCNHNSGPSGPLLEGADGQPIPSWGFIKKTGQFQGKLLHQPFCKQLWLVPSWALTFLRKFKVTVSPEVNQIHLACSAAAQPANFLPSAAPSTQPIFSAASPPLAFFV
jgi:hypothetical protein